MATKNWLHGYKSYIVTWRMPGCGTYVTM